MPMRTKGSGTLMVQIKVSSHNLNVAWTMHDSDVYLDVNIRNEVSMRMQHTVQQDKRERAICQKLKLS